jgi:hypothetical protein
MGGIERLFDVDPEAGTIGAEVGFRTAMLVSAGLSAGR